MCYIVVYILATPKEPDMTKISAMEVFKQFAFATVFFVTCISIHWNFVGQNSQKNLVMQKKQQQKIQIKVLDQQLAMNQSNKTARL